MYNYYIVIIDQLPMFVPVLELVLCVNIVLFSSIYPIPTFLKRGGRWLLNNNYLIEYTIVGAVLPLRSISLLKLVWLCNSFFKAVYI